MYFDINYYMLVTKTHLDTIITAMFIRRLNVTCVVSLLAAVTGLGAKSHRRTISVGKL